MTMRTHVFGEYLHENESIFFNRLACSYGAHEEFFFYQKRTKIVKLVPDSVKKGGNRMTLVKGCVW